eukprot:TRINITY_DN10883_c0_g1_i1.p1 TRINITY_DN10883_c0_g1~~TRINITY_DN10883_c0_g1_i1.p1  ORF type:complete len:364 (-),score=46.22 TRINITY_DN10883_c0_g1_i1:100-1191(-)
MTEPAWASNEWLSPFAPEGRKTTVCVTGGNGFLATHLIKQLLERGYKVNTTVRDPTKSIPILFELFPNAMQDLRVYKAELSSEEDFVKALEGCSACFHLAAPMIFGVAKDPTRELVQPSLKGVESVFYACARTKVKNIVMTSSTAAIHGFHNELPGEGRAMYTETDWNLTSSLTEGSYSYAKVRAEKRAWELAAEFHIRLITLNPSLMIGPILYPCRLNESIKLIHDMMMGTYPGTPSVAFGFIDVRDVARIHILAAESKTASGRYICDNGSLWLRDVCDLLIPHFPNHPIPKSKLWNFLSYGVALIDSRLTWNWLDNSLDYKPLFDTTKLRNEFPTLEFTPLHISLIDTVNSLIKFRYIPAR